MEENIIQIKSGIMINAGARVAKFSDDDSIDDDSVIMCDEIIKQTKTIPTNFNEKNITCKIQNFLLVFLLITIAVLIAVSIYCYLIKYRAKKKHLLPFHVTNNELKEVIY